MHILAADIGGTYARFALIHISAQANENMNSLCVVHEQSFLSASFTHADPLLQAVATWLNTISPCPLVRTAVIAVAGPVINNTCLISNLGWSITAQRVEHSLAIPCVLLINDFIAQGYAAKKYKQFNSLCVHAGQAAPNAPLAIIGAGTGCGKAVYLPAEDLVLPSEGGHCEVAFAGNEEFAFAEFVCQQTGEEEITGDMIVSGQGLELLFHYHTGIQATAPEIAPQLAKYPNVLACFARLYGRNCKNFLLDTLARGGLIITGGVAAKIPVLQHPAFLKTLQSSRQQHLILTQIPIWHMKDTRSGLYGAAYYGWKHRQDL